LRAVRGLAVPVEQLERLDEALRAGGKPGPSPFPDAAREALGWSVEEANTIMKGLGFAPIRRPGAETLWRRRGEREFALERKPVAPHSPFAALAALRPEAPAMPARRRRRPRKTAARP
jgi:ATP-dependent RNA helicase SUPV3L1/SUV3